MARILESGGTVEDKIAHFLLQYQVTPHTTTGISPAELYFFSHCLRARLELNLKQQVEGK